MILDLGKPKPFVTQDGPTHKNPGCCYDQEFPDWGSAELCGPHVLGMALVQWKEVSDLSPVILQMWLLIWFPGLPLIYLGSQHRWRNQCFASLDRLAGLVVKWLSASGAKDPGFQSRLRRDFSRSSHTSDFKKMALQWLPCQCMAL